MQAADILFQLGVVRELQGEANEAKALYERVLRQSPNSAKVLTQLGWLLQQEAHPRTIALTLTQIRGARGLRSEAWTKPSSTLRPQCSWTLQTPSLGARPPSCHNMLPTEHTGHAAHSNIHGRYLLGRCYMSLQEYKNAFSSYTQAVCRDENNPAYWCSIGALYYKVQTCTNFCIMCQPRLDSSSGRSISIATRLMPTLRAFALIPGGARYGMT